MWERCIAQEHPSCQDRRSFFNGQRERGIPAVSVPCHGPALAPQKAAASPLCDAAPRLPDHAVHGHVQHVFQRLPVAGPLPDAGACPADGLDR